MVSVDYLPDLSFSRPRNDTDRAVTAIPSGVLSSSYVHPRVKISMTFYKKIALWSYTVVQSSVSTESTTRPATKRLCSVRITRFDTELLK